MTYNIKKIDIILSLVIVFMVFMVCREALLTGEPLRPGNDSYYLDFPFRLLAWESIRNFEWPLWNPYNSGGINLLGQPFFFLLYPPYWLTYLFDKNNIFYILSLIQIFHLAAAGIGMYFLLRKIVKDPFISLWGGILYTFSYPVMDAFIVGQLLVSFVYLPWIVLFLYTVQKRNLASNLLILSPLIFLMVGGGFPQWNLFTLIIIFLFLVLRYKPWTIQRKKLFFGLALFITAGIIAFLLGGIELIPFIEQYAIGARSHGKLSAILRQDAVPWFFSLRLLIPNLFSSDLYSFTSDHEIFLPDTFNSYYGLAAFLLTILGLIFLKRKWATTWKILFVLVFLGSFGTEQFKVFFYFLFMKADMLYTRVGNFLPFIGVILSAAMLKKVLADRNKMNYLLILMVLTITAFLVILFPESFAYIKTFLVEAELNEQYIQTQILIGLVVMTAYLGAFLLFYCNYMRQTSLMILLCVFAFMEMKMLPLKLYEAHLSVKPTAEYFDKTNGEKMLEDILGDRKNYFRSHNTSVRLAGLTHEEPGPYMHYFPNSNIFNKFYEINGYILNMQKDIGQLMTHRRGNYFIRMADLLIYENLPTLLSLRYVITLQDLEPSKLLIHPSRKFEIVKDFTDGPPGKEYRLRLIEIKNVPPRFYFTKSVKPMKDRGEIFDRVINPSFEPREVTYFEEPVATESFDTSIQKILEVKIPSANQVIIKTGAKTPGVLIANNFFHKWWRVEVNQKPAKLYRVNFLFQGVKIPAGISTIRFYCRAGSLEFGKYVSVLGMVIMIILAVFAYKKSHRGCDGRH